MPRRFNYLLLCYALLLAVTSSPPMALSAPSPVNSALEIAAPGSGPFGLNTHLATRYTNIATLDTPAEVVAQAGVSWVREDLHWYRIQPTPDSWDWSFTDAAFRALLKRNIKIVAVLGHPPGWATPYSADAPAAHSFYAPDVASFARFAQEAVRRYGQYVQHWEIWNEPDHVNFWKPAPDPLAYAALLTQVAATIRNTNPQAKIIFGGINPFDTDFLRKVADNGGWNAFDILAIHPYVDPARPEAGVIGTAADGVRAILARYGKKPIWVTEIGWASGPGDRDPSGSTDQQAQANYLVRAMLLLWQGGVERIFWYTLKDDPGSPYGLVTLGEGRDDFRQLKPAFYALQTLNRQTANAEFVARRDLFTRTIVDDFDSTSGWLRGDQPYGTIQASESPGRDGRALRLGYSFPQTGKNFVAFLRERPPSIPGEPYALGMWVYGDGSAKTLKLWLRDARGEVLQFALGRVGMPGWQFLSTPLGGAVAEWNCITKGGDGRAQFPVSLYGLVIDNAPDGLAGRGALYLDDLTAVSGPEAYNIQLRQGEYTLDWLWAPAPLRARLLSSAANGQLVSRDGYSTTIQSAHNAFTLDLGPAPLIVIHRRT